MVSQTLVNSEVGQAQGSCGLALGLIYQGGLCQVTDDGEVQSEIQRARVGLRLQTGVSVKFRREKSVEESCRMGTETASHCVCLSAFPSAKS